MLPIGDVIPTRTTPWITVALIAASTLVFVFETQLNEAARAEFIVSAGFVAASSSVFGVDALTSMFVHVDWLRLVANIVALWTFGPAVEDRMGHARFLVFYAASGVAGALTHAWAASGSTMPLVGAGAALTGVMSAYFVMFPYSRVLVLVFLVVSIDIIELPALSVVGFWLLSQLAGGVGRLAGAPVDDAGLWSYAGGLAAGLAGVWLFRRRDRLRVDWWG